MKKVYEKPKMLIESFHLTEHIANECRLPKTSDSQPINYNDWETCAYTDGSFVIFMSEENGCDMDVYNPAVDGPVENFLHVDCHNAFTDVFHTFAS